MGMPVAYPGARVHSSDRPGTLHRGVHGQLGVQRVSGHPGTHLRPSMRAGVPSRADRGKTRRDLPPEARRRRPQGRHSPVSAGRAEEKERQAHRAAWRRPRLSGGGARSAAAGIRDRHVRPRSRGRRHDAQPDSGLPPARGSAGGRGRSDPGHGRQRPLQLRDYEHEGNARHGLRRLLRGYRRAAWPRPRPARTP